MSESTTLPDVTDDDRAWLVSVLKLGSVEVTFTKADGTDRLMNCTLRKDLLPEREEKESVSEKKESVDEKPKNKDLVIVWDLDKGAWRSFKLSTIKTVNFDSEARL